MDQCQQGLLLEFSSVGVLYRERQTERNLLALSGLSAQSLSLSAQRVTASAVCVCVFSLSLCLSLCAAVCLCCCADDYAICLWQTSTQYDKRHTLAPVPARHVRSNPCPQSIICVEGESGINPNNENTKIDNHRDTWSGGIYI